MTAGLADGRWQDVAGSKLAFQSSQARNSVASAAVDGDNGTCTITKREDQPYWTVELGAIYTVSAVYINAGTRVVCVCSAPVWAAFTTFRLSCCRRDRKQVTDNGGNPETDPRDLHTRKRKRSIVSFAQPDSTISSQGKSERRTIL